MVKIDDGFNGKPMEIRVNKGGSKGIAELWIEFGVEKPRKETLSYLDLYELLKLRDEINEAILSIVGLKNE